MMLGDREGGWLVSDQLDRVRGKEQRICNETRWHPHPASQGWYIGQRGFLISPSSVSRSFLVLWHCACWDSLCFLPAKRGRWAWAECWNEHSLHALAKDWTVLDHGWGLGGGTRNRVIPPALSPWEPCLQCMFILWRAGRNGLSDICRQAGWENGNLDLNFSFSTERLCFQEATKILEVPVPSL